MGLTLHTAFRFLFSVMLQGDLLISQSAVSCTVSCVKQAQCQKRLELTQVRRIRFRVTQVRRIRFRVTQVRRIRFRVSKDSQARLKHATIDVTDICCIPSSHDPSPPTDPVVTHNSVPYKRWTVNEDTHDGTVKWKMSWQLKFPQKSLITWLQNCCQCFTRT
jgi:hypothetical protein